MACSSWSNDWIAHLYGELAPEQERALVDHLEGCAACRQTMDDLSASRQLLREYAPPVPGTPLGHW